MTRNRTLGEFESGTDTAGPTPIQPVQRWHPAPTTCPRCGESVKVLWLADAVAGSCHSCKEW